MGIVVYDYSGAEITTSRWLGNHFEFIGGDTKRIDPLACILTVAALAAAGPVAAGDLIFPG